MAATYTQFTEQEIVSALPNGFDERGQAGGELTYSCVFRNGMKRWRIVCYTGLDAQTGLSRSVGSDAIRFVLLDRVSNRPVGKTTRVHRTGDVASLRIRLLDRSQELATLARSEEGYRCRRCGAATVEREAKTGPNAGKTFRGCLRWQDCKNLVPTTLDGQREEQPAPPAPVVREQPLPAPQDTAQVELVPTSSFPHCTFPFPNFNPMQSLVVPHIAKGVNIVVAAPTSAGKTVVAELAIAEALSRGKVGIFLSPLKAVTTEKYEEWTTGRFATRRISIVTGDFQLTKERQEELAQAEIILLTSEMLDSRTRRMEKENNAWLFNVGALVCDEAHLLTMEDRGHALESGLMRFTLQNPNAKVVLLSATMPNVGELGQWLTVLNEKHTEVIVSEWRPVPHEVHYLPHKSQKRFGYRNAKDHQIQLALDLVTEHANDKFLLFVHEKTTGRQLLERLRAAGIPAEFHSADLNREDRARVEREFRQR